VAPRGLVIVEKKAVALPTDLDRVDDDDIQGTTAGLAHLDRRTSHWCSTSVVECMRPSRADAAGALTPVDP
jgi:hypothetical protein